MLAQRPSFGYAMKKNNADKQQEQGVVDMETSRPTRLSPSGKPRTSTDRLAPEASARPSAATSPEAASATATPDKSPASAASATPGKSPASAAPATSPADSSPTANPAASDDIKEKPRRKKISAPTATPVSSGTPPTNAPEASARPSAATSPEAASETATPDKSPASAAAGKSPASAAAGKSPAPAAAGKSPAPAASATPGKSASADLDDEEEADFAEPEILPADEEELVSDFGSGLSEGDDLFDSDHVIDLLPPGGEGDLPVPSSSRLPTPSARDNLQLYLREVSRFPLLSPDEEVELARRVRDTGDSDAAFRIISSHLRLVVKIAMDFQRRWMQNVLDLIQEGNVGLMRAVNKFDPDKGIKFSYYATFWIRAYILKFIMDNWRMVKIGTTQAQRKLFYNLNKERQKLIAQGFDPSANALSERLGVTEDQIVEMQQRLDAGDVSLDLPVSEESGSSTRMDFLPALGPGIEDSYGDSEVARLVRDGIRDILPRLSEKEAYILEHRLLTDDPVTLREIGERYHVTRERIRQLEARLLAKLRAHLGEEIRDFSEDWINPQA